MMASKKSEAGTQRPKQKSGKQLGMMQFVLIGVGIIALIVIALLLGSGGGKKAAAPRTKTAADSVSTSDRARKFEPRPLKSTPMRLVINRET